MQRTQHLSIIFITLFFLFPFFQNVLGEGKESKKAGKIKKAEKAQRILVVIVNKKNKAKKLTITQVRSIYLKQTSGWKVLDRKSKRVEKKNFLKLIIKKNQRKWQDYWVKQRIQNGTFSPPAYRKDYTILKLISRKKKAIGYLFKKTLSKKKYKKYVKKIRVVLEIKIGAKEGKK